MKTIVTASLVVLLFGVVSLWTIQEAAPQPQELEGWMLVDFSPRGNAARLWEDAGSPDETKDRWTRTDCRGGAPSRPSNRTRIIRIDSVARIVGDSIRRDPQRRYRLPARWDAFVEMRAVNVEDFRRAARYIELCYSHVEGFRVTGRHQ